MGRSARPISPRCFPPGESERARGFVRWRCVGPTTHHRTFVFDYLRESVGCAPQSAAFRGVFSIQEGLIASWISGRLPCDRRAGSSCRDASRRDPLVESQSSVIEPVGRSSGRSGFQGGPVHAHRTVFSIATQRGRTAGRASSILIRATSITRSAACADSRCSMPSGQRMRISTGSPHAPSPK